MSLAWTSTCAICHLAAAECACVISDDMQEQRRRLDAGIAALAVMPEAERDRLADEALRRATTPYLTDEDAEPPSYTRWQRDIESDRMQEALT